MKWNKARSHPRRTSAIRSRPTTTRSAPRRHHRPPRTRPPAGGDCAGKPCCARRRRLRHRDPAATPDGITSLVLRPAPTSRPVQAKGRGALLAMPPLASIAGPLRVHGATRRVGPAGKHGICRRSTSNRGAIEGQGRLKGSRGRALARETPPTLPASEAHANGDGSGSAATCASQPASEVDRAVRCEGSVPLTRHHPLRPAELELASFEKASTRRRSGRGNARASARRRSGEIQRIAARRRSQRGAGHVASLRHP